MKREGKIIAFSILALMMVAFVATLVPAPTPTTQPSGGDPITPVANAAAAQAGKSALDSAKDWWGKSSLNFNDQTKGMIAKVLLMFLVVLLVYSVMEFVPIFSKKESIHWAIAVVVGLLSFLFVDIETIRAIETNYQALGVVLTSVLPLIIIFVFSYQLKTSGRLNAGVSWFLSTLLISFFIFYSLVKWITFRPLVGNPYPEVIYCYPISIILAILWLLFGEKLLSKIGFKEQRALIADFSEVELSNAEMARAKRIAAKLEAGHELNEGELAFVRAKGIAI